MTFGWNEEPKMEMKEKKEDEKKKSNFRAKNIYINISTEIKESFCIGSRDGIERNDKKKWKTLPCLLKEKGEGEKNNEIQKTPRRYRQERQVIPSYVRMADLREHKTEKWKRRCIFFPGATRFIPVPASPGSRDTDATRRRWPRLGPGLAGIGARQTDAGSPIWKFIWGRLACIMDAG